MLWLVQNNAVEKMTGRVAEALRATGREMFDFSVVPGESLPAFPLNPNEKHFFYGSTGLISRLREDLSWAPYVFEDEASLDARTWSRVRPADMLNGECVTMTLEAFVSCAQSESAPKLWPNGVFVRPTVRQKAFAGQVVKNGDVSGLYTARNQQRVHPEGMLVSVSDVVELTAEYRFIVLNNEIKLGSSYRVNGQHHVSADIPADVLAAAAELAKGWMPSSLTVMDVAILKDGRAVIVEFNAPHSAGLYAIDIPAFLDVVESAVNAAH